jgi:cytochrome c
MKPGHVVYIRLKGNFVSEKNQDLWSTECWYTLNNIPQNEPGFANEVEKPKGDNMLTEAEKDAGWMLLFDGKTTKGWRGYQTEKIGSSWKVRNGILTLDGPKKDGRMIDAGNILTDQPYENYELALEWNIAPGGNSGIIYNVVEMEGVGNPWETGPEMQILDNAMHPDAKFRTHRAGDLYDMIECKFVTVKPAGEWNSVRLIVNKGKVQQWQNGYKVVEYDMNDASWPEMIAKSKFKDMPHFGKSASGHICLQDHNDVVSFRNIKIRLLDKGL